MDTDRTTSAPPTSCRGPGVSGRLTHPRPEASQVPPGVPERGRASGSEALADLVPQHLRAGAAEPAQKGRFPRSFQARGFPRRCVLSHERFVDLKRAPTSHLYTGGCVLGLTFVSALPRPAIVTAPQLHTMASHCCGLSRCGAQAPDAQAQRPWLTGPAALRHVRSSRTRARTHVPCIGRRTLNHCTTREAGHTLFIPLSWGYPS
nr:uncharacterized protein LOC132429550 [Delphinus delphis]